MCEKLFGSLLGKSLSRMRCVTYKCGTAFYDFFFCHGEERLEGADSLKREYWYWNCGYKNKNKVDHRCSGILRSVDWWLVTVVSGQPVCLIFRGPIRCSETSVTTNLRCVTPQKSEDIIYIVAETWNRARMQYFGGSIFIFGIFHFLSWGSSELPDGYWNSAFKLRSVGSVSIAFN